MCRGVGIPQLFPVGPGCFSTGAEEECEEAIPELSYIAPIERSAKLRESSERRDYGHEKTMDRQGKARDSA